MDNDVIVASVQSLARDPTRLLKYNPKQFKCIITDEAHHATSPSYAKILHHFRVHEKNKSHILLAGFTATAWRHDGVGLNTVFDEIVFHRSFMDMIEKHWLCPLRFETVNTGTDLADVDEAGKDFQERKLSEKINTSKRNASVVNAYRAHCDSRRKATVVFAADVKHSVAITEEFEEQGYHARSITNHTNAKERARLLQDFRDGKFPILVNCGMMTEGADFPMIDAIIIARPTKSTVLMVQMLGRGVRLHSGKVDCLVLDMVDTVDRKAFSIVPVLFGLDPKVPSSIITSARVTRIRRDGRSFGKYMLMGITREDLTSAHSSPTMELQYIPTTFATEHEKDLNQDDLALHVPDSPVNGEQDVVVKEHPLSTGHGADENGVQADEWSDAPNGVGNVPAIPKDTEATEAVWYDTDGSSQVHIKENISESHDASFSWWPSIWDATDESRGRTALTAFFQDLKTKLGWSEMETTENRSDQVNGEILQDDPLDLIKESPLTNMRVLQVDDELFYVLVNEQQLKILYKNGHPPIKVVRKGQGDLVEPRRAAEKGKNQAKESRQESE
ncbi:hypothetical protein BGX34_009686 [Mortierella sp. NVP85]|nr:hypothetical protein BGX34_009686 [Mortierella sp. NVP85]